MFGKSYARTWFVLMLAAVVVAAPSLSVSAAPAAVETPRGDVLGAVAQWWQGWLQALSPQPEDVPSPYLAVDAQRQRDPVEGTAPQLDGGDAVSLRVTGEDSPKMDPDG